MFKQNLRPKKCSEKKVEILFVSKIKYLGNGQEVLKISKRQKFHFFFDFTVIGINLLLRMQARFSYFRKSNCMTINDCDMPTSRKYIIHKLNHWHFHSSSSAVAASRPQLFLAAFSGGVFGMGFHSRLKFSPVIHAF